MGQDVPSMGPDLVSAALPERFPGQFSPPAPSAVLGTKRDKESPEQGQTALESCYQMAEIHKPSRYVYTAACSARSGLRPAEALPDAGGDRSRCGDRIVSLVPPLHRQPLVTGTSFYLGLAVVPWPLPGLRQVRGEREFVLFGL